MSDDIKLKISDAADIFSGVMDEILSKANQLEGGYLSDYEAVNDIENIIYECGHGENKKRLSRATGALEVVPRGENAFALLDEAQEMCNTMGDIQINLTARQLEVAFSILSQQCDEIGDDLSSVAHDDDEKETFETLREIVKKLEPIALESAGVKNERS